MQSLFSRAAISKIIAIIIAIIVIVAAIGGAYYYSTLQGPSPPTEKDTIVVAVPYDAATIDPGTAQASEVDFCTINGLYEGLIQNVPVETSDGRILTWSGDQFEGKVAESWEHNNDFTQWTFHLRHNLTFHSGHPITAREVVWSFKEYHFQETTGSVIAMAGGFADGVEALDNYTVRMTLSKGSSSFLSYICQSATGVILDMDLINENGGVTPYARQPWLSNHDAGSGPYVLDHWTPGVEIVMKAFDNYWREGYPKTKTVIYRIIPDIETQKMLLQNGEVDIIWNLPPKDVDRMNDMEGVTAISKPSANTLFLELRTENQTGYSVPAFTNQLVREAMRYTVPYDEIISEIQYGYASRLGSIVPWNFPDYVDVYTAKYNYNLTKAQELLEEAGYAEGFTFTLTFGAGMVASQEEMILAWQSELSKIDVTMNIQILPAPTYNKLMQSRQLNVWFVNWVSLTADPYYQLFWFATADIELGGFAGNPCDFVDQGKDPSIQPELQDLWYSGLFNPNPTNRTAIAKQCQQLAIDKSYHILISSANLNVAMRDDIRGFYIHLDGFIHPQHLYVVTS